MLCESSGVLIVTLSFSLSLSLFLSLLPSLPPSLPLSLYSQPAAIRPSYSEPNLVRCNVLPSLRSLLYDENGVTLVSNYVINNNINNNNNNNNNNSNL